MKKFTFLFVSFVLLFSVTIYFTFTISRSLSVYHDKKSEIAEQLDFKVRFTDVWEYVPFSSTADDRVALWQELENSANYHYQSALKQGVIMGALVMILFFRIFSTTEKEIINFRFTVWF